MIWGLAFALVVLAGLVGWLLTDVRDLRGRLRSQSGQLLATGHQIGQIRLELDKLELALHDLETELTTPRFAAASGLSRIAKLLDQPKSRVHRLLQSGQLPGTYAGGVWHMSPEQLGTAHTYFRNHSSEPQLEEAV